MGIGTTAPALGLDVANGTLGLRNSAAWDHTYWFHDGSTAVMRAGGAETGLSLQVGAGGSGSYGDASQNYRDVLRLLPSGNVGVGTTTPTARLHVRGAANAYPATSGTTQSPGLIGRYQTSDNAILDLGGNSGNGFWLQSTDITTLALNYPLMLNPNGGNVGIGTTAPAQKLDVVGNAAVSGNAYVNGALGVALNGQDRPLITRGYDLFATGAYTGAGRWGLFMEPNTLTFGVPALASRNFQWATYNVNSTVASSLMTLTQAGQLGIGITAPAANLDVAAGPAINDATPANVTTTGVRLSRPGTFNQSFGAAAELALGRYGGGGDDSQRAQLDFKLGNGFNTLADQTVLTLRGDGNVGIGTAAPVAGLHIDRPQATTTGLGVVLSGGTNGNPSIELRGSGRVPFIDFSETAAVDYTTRLISSGGVLAVDGAGSGGVLMQVNGGLRATSYANLSDRRFKQNVRPIGGALASVLALRGVRYEWNALGVKHGGTAGAGQVGLIAQELEALYPELVHTDAAGYKSVNYAQLTPVLIEALKEQQQQIDLLKAQNAALQAKSAQAEADHASLLTLQAQVARLLGEGAQARK